MNLPNPIIEGIFENVAEPEYRSAPGISQSEIKDALDRSPGHYAESKKSKREATAAMEFGTICHHLILTPEAEPCWSVIPAEAPKRPTKAQIESAKPSPAAIASMEFWKKFDANNAGKIIIDLETFTATNQVAVEAMKHPIIKQALVNSRKEVSCFKTFNFGGSVMRKCRIDIDPPGPCLFDFKFVEDARENEFGKQSKNLKYYFQAAYYLDIYNDCLPTGATPKDKFVFIAVEKSAPYGIQVWQVHPEDIEKGRKEYIECLTRYIECAALGQWSVYHPRSSYSIEPKMLKLPNWTKKEKEGLL